MKKRVIFAPLWAMAMTAAALPAVAQDSHGRDEAVAVGGVGPLSETRVEVKEFALTGPYAVALPYASDTVDVQGKKFDESSMLSAVPLQAEATGVFRGGRVPSLSDSKSVGVLTFYLNNSDYLKGKIEVKGLKHYKLFIRQDVDFFK